GLFPLLLIALAAPALLVALEVSSAGKTAAAPAEQPSRRPAAVEEATAAGPAGAALTASSRRHEEAILHDLKSPLSVLRVYAELIAEGAKRGELPNPEHLANLSREIELAEKLVGAAAEPRPAEQARQGVERSGFPAAEAAPASASADLVEILGSLATAYRLSLGGRRRIEFIAEKPELTVAADPVALQRAFRNVLENAVKYTPEGGEIRIRAGPAGPHAFVVFKDTGIGMTPEERRHAFDYAFRGSGAVASGARGKGIGLAVTKEILEANGGRISLSSEAGFGSEVTILLPFARGAR
ncbi:MAG: sensor histidine kinase, partial [Thermoanaerobaculia bacterium]